MSENFDELHENHSLFCAENIGHAEKTVIKEMNSDKTDECKVIVAMDLINENERETDNGYNEIKTYVKSETTDRQTAKMMQ